MSSWASCRETAEQKMKHVIPFVEYILGSKFHLQKCLLDFPGKVPWHTPSGTDISKFRDTSKMPWPTGALLDTHSILPHPYSEDKVLHTQRQIFIVDDSRQTVESVTGRCRQTEVSEERCSQHAGHESAGKSSPGIIPLKHTAASAEESRPGER